MDGDGSRDMQELLRCFPALKDVTFHVLTPEEIKENYLRRRREVWPDNASFARKMNARIERRADKMYSQVRAAVRALMHTKFGFAKLTAEYAQCPDAVGALMEYRRVSIAYASFMSNLLRCENIVRECDEPHPSRTIPVENAEHLRERGFSSNAFGWFDVNGAAIRVRHWIWWENPTHDSYVMHDPARIQLVVHEFDELFEQARIIFGANLAAYEAAYGAAVKVGRRDFKMRRVCEPPRGLIEKGFVVAAKLAGWEAGFAEAKEYEEVLTKPITAPSSSAELAELHLTFDMACYFLECEEDEIVRGHWHKRVSDISAALDSVEIVEPSP